MAVTSAPLGKFAPGSKVLGDEFGGARLGGDVAGRQGEVEPGRSEDDP